MGRKKSNTCADLRVQVARLELQPPHLGEIQEAVQQVLQPLAFPLDKLDLSHARRSRGASLCAKVLGQKLHIQPDRGERILDLVGQTARQPGNLRVLIDQPLIDGIRGHGNWRL